jgi:uncharacterized protein RhaS with RHS repeats
MELYYYGARYYDPQIGRFISPDTIVPDPANPQTLNRYSYCLNNPLKYTDPSGNTIACDDDQAMQAYLEFIRDGGADIAQAMNESDTIFYLYMYNNNLNIITNDQISLLKQMRQAMVGSGPDMDILRATAGFVGILKSDDAIPYIGKLDNLFIYGITVGAVVYGGFKVDQDIIELQNYLNVYLAKSGEAYDKHKQGIENAKHQVDELEKKLGASKSPNERAKIKNEIDALEKAIKGHQKEMRQKWPFGRP